MLSRSHPLARRSGLLFEAFRLYLRWYFWRRFHAILLARSPLPSPPRTTPLIIYTNHPSWWDPALLMLALQHLLPGRKGFGPMEQTELQRYGLFRAMGLFPLDLKTRASAKDFLKTARAGLATPGACLVITAEGAFTDPRLRPITLRPGLAHLARLCPEAIVIPVAIDYMFWNESTPEALLRFGNPVRPAANTTKAWQQALEAELTATMDSLAAASSTRNPALFIKLFSGTAGTGGLYSLWSRLRAWSRGRAYRAEHHLGGG